MELKKTEMEQVLPSCEKNLETDGYGKNRSLGSEN